MRQPFNHSLFMEEQQPSAEHQDLLTQLSMLVPIRQAKLETAYSKLKAAQQQYQQLNTAYQLSKQALAQQQQASEQQIQRLTDQHLDGFNQCQQLLTWQDKEQQLLDLIHEKQQIMVQLAADLSAQQTRIEQLTIEHNNANKQQQRLQLMIETVETDHG